MTFQPPPPPGPGGPPAGGWGPPSGGSPAPFDPKAVNPLDWGIVAAGALAFVFSFISYYTVDVSAGPYSVSDSASAWHGFFGWFAALLAIVGSAVVAIALFAPQVSLPVPARLAGLGAYAVATLCVIIALFVIPDGGAGNIPGVSTGHGFGYWVSLIVIIAGLALSLMRFQATGGQLPGGMNSRIPNVGGYGPQGGISGGQPPAPGQYPPAPGQTPPPPPGYGPPQ